MIVRCGACRTEFDAPGEGRHSCPTCGAVNQVSAAPDGSEQPSAAPPPLTPTPGGAPPAGAAPPAPSGLEGIGTQPPRAEPPAAAPPNEVTCGECQFEFFVGDIEVASCPNCGTEVAVS